MLVFHKFFNEYLQVTLVQYTIAMTFNPESLDSLTPEQVAEFKEQAIQNQRSSVLRGANPNSRIEFNEAFRGWADQPKEISSGLEGFSSEGASIGPVIAEGDSWFDYFPGIDIIDQLRTLGYVFDKNYAVAGDTLENMIFGSQYDKMSYERLSPSLTAVLKRLGQMKHKIFFFSGGGNDIAGEEFGQFLNHKDSGLHPFREDFARQLITDVFRRYLCDLADKVYAASPETVIVIHGYGYTAPTGKAVINAGPFRFVGPWLRPSLVMKGIVDPVEQRSIVFNVIDMYNDTLMSIAGEKRNFRHVDLRGIIDPDSDWVNELHLRNSAYYRVAKQIHESILDLA
jgi:hypothetical protein